MKMLVKTNHQQKFIIAVMINITSQNVISSLQCAAFVIREGILQKYIKADLELLNPLRIKHQSQGQ